MNSISNLKLLGFLFLLIFIFSTMSFVTQVKRISDGPPKDQAVVEQKEGLYIFIQCKPAHEYTFLGTEKKSKLTTWSGSNEQIMSGIIKKIKKDHPDAEGVIFQTTDLEKADAIKFK